MAPATEHVNRLARETSPYLLQHAHNPVDWYPWGPEAFEAARKQDKMIFLSVGYSTCYWCHVMERESFEDEQTAAIMNEHFISIKVDREERPDVDDVYMAATQVYNRGSGGWPMSVFLEPNSLKPVVAGTYFPREDDGGRIGFKTLLGRVAEAWANNRADVEAQADQLAGIVAQQLSQASWSQPIGKAQVDQAVEGLMAGYDATYGGFGHGQNKFPMPAHLDLLIGVAWRQADVRNAVIYTLDRMATGGIYDQVGGGFHRYSTDRKWLVPHFEKMIYDNGQLASTYARALELTGDDYYAEIVRETLDYARREMMGPGGAFYSAQDAEVNAREGQNYVWTADEVRAALEKAGLGDDVEFALDVYGLAEGPNFRDPHHPEEHAANVLFLRDRPDRLAGSMGMAVDDVNLRLQRINAALLAARDTRDQPGTDDKVLAGWNGLMIAAMADGGRVLHSTTFIQTANQAADFVLETLRSDDGGLLRSYRDGRPKVNAFLEDYALMIRGLIALHRATGERRRIEQAAALAAEAKERFWDARFGGYFDTVEGQDDLFVRAKSVYDGAVPSGNGVMLLNLLDLNELTGDEEHLETAIAALHGISSAIAENPISTSLSTLALHRVVAKQPGRLETIGAAAPDEAVTVATDVQRITVGPGAPARVQVTLRIADGHHVNAHDPGLPSLVGLDVQVVGARGLAATADWPAGELYQGEIRVHHGEVRLPVTISQTGPVDGNPRLAVVYQTCTDRVCLRPTTQVLDVEIVTGP